MNSYIKFSSAQLQGAEDRLTFSFRFCSNHGLLLYQAGAPGTRDFLAVGVHDAKIYLEWRIEATLIEVSNLIILVRLDVITVSIILLVHDPSTTI